MEIGLALVTGCIPDLFPVIRHWFPNLLHYDSSYPYVTGSSKHRTRKAFTSLASKNNLSHHNRDSDDINLDDCIWRNDIVTTGEVHVKGGASASSVHGSEEILTEVEDKSQGIVKTTPFIVREIIEDIDDIDFPIQGLEDPGQEDHKR